MNTASYSDVLIKDCISKDKPCLSFEIFPPKEWAKIEDTKKVAKALSCYAPSFISVTYGAGGGTSDYTFALTQQIVEKYHVPALAHLTCVGSDKEKVEAALNEMQSRGIKNILALRGDIPANSDFSFSKDFRHADELMRFIKEKGDFCIGGACYPEGHPESASTEADIESLKRKIDAGADFLTTQMFFDNNIFYTFRMRMLGKGMDIPVLPGIMPIVNAKSIKRICAVNGTPLPPRFKAIVDRFGDDPKAMKQAGIAYATEQIIDLFANGVNHIHLYTMNRPEVAGAIINNLSGILA